MTYTLDARDFKEKNIWDLGQEFSGKTPLGEEISFTNYYMQRNKKPFFGISGEFHFTRMDENYWEDEIAKMKMGGINIVSTYVFWNHHEEEEGLFDFSGRRNLRKFVELCKKYELYVILRVGPFNHGEVRNGGIPDWLYGKPFEVRQLNDGFISHVKRLYQAIAKEVEGLFYKDGGPIIGSQIDNEYMHSSAPWEMTTGVSNEWVFGGNEDDAYMLKLKELAAECGILPVFYTCTAWGGASTPDSMMPLWGGYAYQPWLFYSYAGEHPSTQEYIYQDYHNNDILKTYNFEPRYMPENKPYSCCEMGGGMMCSYYYRFQLPYKSVDAMANIKMASGCNFLGYYVFQGGSNPVGKHGTYLNESQVTKISYDYQACIGEFGQIRESYQRLKTLHFFANTFGERLCGLKTMLPERASDINPKDLDTMRFALRTDGKGGFLFINNFQDHQKMKDKNNESIEIKLKDETIVFENISIAGDENCILPIHFDMDGISLIKATAQPVTRFSLDKKNVYVFMIPDGMGGRFVFEDGVAINGQQNNEIRLTDENAQSFEVSKDGVTIEVLCLSRELCNQMYLLENKGLIFSKEALFVRDGHVFTEGTDSISELKTYPKNLLQNEKNVAEVGGSKQDIGQSVLGFYELKCDEIKVEVDLKQVSENRYNISFPKHFMNNAKNALLRIDYQGDIGHAFIDGRMINDNFSNGATWEIGLRNFAKDLEENPLTIYITPLKEGAKVNVESTMAARIEEVDSAIGTIDKVSVAPVYEHLVV